VRAAEEISWMFWRLKVATGELKQLTLMTCPWSWKAAVATAKVTSTRGYRGQTRSNTFWDWAFLEPLVQSELRTEEASEQTTLDIRKRRLIVWNQPSGP
jgi:hypothetical protein